MIQEAFTTAVQAQAVKKATPWAKTRHKMYRSFKSVHPFFAQLTLLPNPQNPMLYSASNRPDTPKVPLPMQHLHLM